MFFARLPVVDFLGHINLKCPDLSKISKISHLVMLVSAHIHSFRSCSNVLLSDVGSMLIFLGRNGVGKTNVLLAIEWVAQVAASESADIPMPQGENLGDVSLRMNLEGKVYEYRLTISISVEKDSDGEEAQFRLLKESLQIELQDQSRESVFSREGKNVIYGTDHKRIEISGTSPAAFAIASLLPNDPVTDVITKVMNFLYRVRYLPLDTPSKEENDYGIVRESELIANKSRSRKVSDSKQLQIQLVELFKNENTRFKEFVELVGERGLGVISNVKVQRFEFPGGKDEKSELEFWYFVRWQPANAGNQAAHSFRDLSYGTRRLLRLFITLIYARPTILLIEQPEDGIHKGLLHKLIPTLESYCDSCQIIVASHASDILNRADPEQIRLVTMVHGDTEVRKLEDDELEAAHIYIASEGGLSDFLDMVQG